MIISARPYSRISTLFSTSGYYDLTHIEFYYLGRDALLSGFVALGLKKGDSVIIPAYMCDSTIKPLKAYGFNLVFIDIDESLDLPVDKIRKVVKKDNSIKALLTVHYFGLTQNFDKVIDVCRECGVKVIEDASHSFMSQLLRNKGGIRGDAEVFSMRKNLPIIDGGALRINHDSYDEAKNSTSKCVSITSDFKYLILRLLEKISTGLGINIYGQFINNIKTKLRSKNSNAAYEFNTKPCQSSWQLRKYIGNEEYLQNTQHIIVTNFNQLIQALQNLGFRVLVESIEDNVVPQACIVYDDKGGLVDYLRSKGVGAWRWPDEELPEEVAQNSELYQNAIFFDESLVLIPIHQSLSNKQINYIIQVLSRWQL